MSRRQKKHEEEEHENHERWLVSYADMVTLLMCVFIVLFAMATVDQRKFAELAASFTGENNPKPSVLDGNVSVIDGGTPQKLDRSSAGPSVIELPQTKESAAAAAALKQLQLKELERKRENDNLEKAKEEIQNALDARGMGETVRFRREPKGLVVTIVTDRVLFDLGKATVRHEGEEVLHALGPPLSHLPNPISVEGHTDNLPISGGGPFPTNWELSTTRATSVLRFLVDHEGVAASRLSASGYADQRPVVPNDSAEHRSQNRRVEVVVHTMVDDSAPVTTVEDNESVPESAANLPELPTLPEKPVITLPVAQPSTEEH